MRTASDPQVVAALSGHRDTVQLLLDRGAGPDHLARGWNAVEYARLDGHEDMVALIE